MDKEKLIKDILGKEAHIVQPLVGGMMNQSFIVANNERKYVLYISTKQANEMVDRDLEKEHQAIIYKLGITSKNVYFDVANGIKINEYIEGHSLDKIENFDYQKVAQLLKKLHDSPIKAKEDYGPFDRFINYEKEANAYVIDQDEKYLLLRNYLFSYQQFLKKQEKVLSHNDAQRSNIVLGDDNNYYLIDFEFVGNNDPIYDIAAFANGEVKEGYQVLLETYQNPSEEEILRFYLWRIFLSLQWYNVALVKHYRGEGKTHHIDFLGVAKHFIDNAFEAYQNIKK